MKTTVKKWALNLVLLSLMASCGGDNNATGGGSNNSPDSGFNNSSPSSSGTARSHGFIEAFENNGFAGGGVGQDFYYISNQNSSSNCDEWWIFNYCTSSSSGGGSFGTREVTSDANSAENQEIYRYGSLDGRDDWGGTLNQLKQTIVNRMKDAQNDGKAYKCLQYSGYSELCYTHQQWSEIFHYCRGSSNNPYYFNSSQMCMVIGDKDPRNERSKRYLFTENDLNFVIDLNEPLGAQPVSFESTDGRVFIYDN